MTTAWKTMVLVVPAVLVAACTDGDRAPAEAAMQAASAAMESLKGDATKYAPDEVKALESSYGVAKASLANKDYQGVISFTRDIPARAKEALAKAEAAKAELARSWKEAGDGVTKAMDAAKHRLAGSKKPPAGMDKAALARAHAEIASIEAGWAAAAAQYQSGDLKGAVARATELNSRSRDLLAHLGPGTAAP